MIYDKAPIEIGVFQAEVKEFFRYLYLPIKLAGSAGLTMEPRLTPLEKIVGVACCDFVGRNGLDSFIESYVYLTAVNAYQSPGESFNRPGWHSDGFGTGDISYIWSDKQPTVFNPGAFRLCGDDTLSMEQMEEQAKPCCNYQFPNNTLLRLDQYVIHRVGSPVVGTRCFAKIAFSRDQYRLLGNSINHDLDYSWNYVPRKVGRNIPQQPRVETL